MLLQKIFFTMKDKYSISIDEIDDLFDIEENANDLIIYKNIISRFDNVLQLKFENMYIESKSIKNKLNSFLKIYLWKKSINSEIDKDLFLTSLDDFNEKYVISLLEGKTIYKFRISDIVNLWVLSLTHTDGLFVRPVCVKNPYTNLEFSKTSLYNIFFKLLYTGFIIPPLITSFIRYHLDIHTFKIRNYPELKELSILNFIREGSYLEKYEQIINMLHDNRKVIDYYTMASLCVWSVKKRAIEVFNNHLFLYLESEYSCNPLIKNVSKNRLKEKLKEFKEREPTFGFSRIDVVRYVPLDERDEEMRRIRETYQTIPPPPIDYLRSRRQNTINRYSIPPPPHPPPPPPPPPIRHVWNSTQIPPLPPLSSLTSNEIVRNYSPPDTTDTNTDADADTDADANTDANTDATGSDQLPQIRINNFIAQTNIITNTNNPENITTTEETLVNAQVTIESTNTPSDIRYLMNTRNRTRDILQQIENIINVQDNFENVDISGIENDEFNFENVDISGIENDEFNFETEIENPFSPQNELSRSPPPEPNNYPEILEQLLPNISTINTQEIIDRLNTVIDREINSDPVGN